MISETALRSAIVATIHAADSAAKVHRRRRYPAGNVISEYLRLFREDAIPGPGQINAWTIRRVQRRPVVKGVTGRLISTTHEYELRFYYGLLDSDDDSVASEEKAQLKIETIAAAFEADVSIGLGACVEHNGFELPTDFDDVFLGDAKCHRALCRLTVKVANVNC